MIAMPPTMPPTIAPVFELLLLEVEDEDGDKEEGVVRGKLVGLGEVVLVVEFDPQ